MQAQRIHYRTRGGPTQGWGNIFRLASFADWCRARDGSRPTFFVEGPDEVVRYLEKRDFEVVHLGDEVSLAEEARVLANHPAADVTIVEMLEVTASRQKLLRKHTSKLVVFDDLCDHVYDADLVVCGQELPSLANCELSAPGTRFLAGYDYFLSRPEFTALADRQRVHRRQLDRVLVTFGGGRYDVAYLKAAHAFALAGKRRDRSYEATFVLGYAERPDLRAAIERILPDAQVLGGVDDLPDLMRSHDLVVGSAGYTKLEAALSRTPQLMMSVQWHQIPLAGSFALRTGVRDLGYMSYVGVCAFASALLDFEDARERTGSAERARAVVDGHGFQRVYDAIFASESEEDSCTAPAA